jgi:hypothetical protein
MHMTSKPMSACAGDTSIGPCQAQVSAAEISILRALQHWARVMASSTLTIIVCYSCCCRSLAGMH